MAAFRNSGDAGGRAAGEGIKNKIAGPGSGQYDAAQQRQGLLGGVFTVRLFGGARRGDRPDGSHLRATVLHPVFRPVALLHQPVIKEVFGGLVLARPNEGLVGGGEIAAAQIGRGVGLEPGDVIEEVVAEPLQRMAALIDRMIGAADPERAFRL